MYLCYMWDVISVEFDNASQKQYLFPALIEAFSEPTDRVKWNSSIANAGNGLDSFVFVMPFLVVRSQ